MSKPDNIRLRSKTPAQQDNNLSFEEKIRRCSEAMHSGMVNHSGSKDGERTSLSEDELIACLKTHRSSKSRKPIPSKSDSHIPTIQHHSSQKSFHFFKSLKNKLLASMLFHILMAFFLIIVMILGILLCLSLLDRLWMINKEFFTIIFGVISLVGMNVVAYFSSFRWHIRKPWFFLASIFISIIAVCACLALFFD